MKKLLLCFLSVISLCGQLNAQKFVRNGSNFSSRMEYTISPSGISEQIIHHTGFTVSYNSSLLIPNWVAYELTPQEAAATKVSRTDFFEPDPMVKGATALDSDYRGSGYDRGHMAAAADMKWSEKAMEESFYFSNICPQNTEINAGAWLELEQRCRYWAKKYKSSVYIICGPIFVGVEAEYIGDNEVVVPDAFFKVVCQKRDGRWTAAAFVIPNYPSVIDLNMGARPFGVVELMTGYKFLRNLPQADLDYLYGNVNFDDWNIPNWKGE